MTLARAGWATSAVVAFAVGGVACSLLVDDGGYAVGERDGSTVDGVVPNDGGVYDGPVSCAPPGPGTSRCGPDAGESCCVSLPVEGGMFFRTYSAPGLSMLGLGDAAVPPHDPATVNTFLLDKYLVTVARFRQFVVAWDNGSSRGYKPPDGSGKHTYLNSGDGLEDGMSQGTYELGWLPTDNPNIQTTDQNLTSCGYATWTPSPGNNEDRPINCITWVEAYAFCIWDGGFLASAVESEYACAGGSDQRWYPWGNTSPGADDTYAVYNCNVPAPGDDCPDAGSIAPVGSAPRGRGRWGQLDLAGELSSWGLDYVGAHLADPCDDCADLSVADGNRALSAAGSFFTNTPADLLVPLGSSSDPSARSFETGVRCARAPSP